MATPTFVREATVVGTRPLALPAEGHSPGSSKLRRRLTSRRLPQAFSFWASFSVLSHSWSLRPLSSRATRGLTPSGYARRMFRRGKRAAIAGQPPSQGASMRSMVLGLTPGEIGLAPDSTGTVWGVVMDTAMSDGGWHSLIVLADGTTSLYTSAAFGIIGAGSHDSVRAASDVLLDMTQRQLDLFTASQDDAVPPPGRVAIRALTFEGPGVLVAPEDELGHGRHAASPLFHAAHEVITRMRSVTPD